MLKIRRPLGRLIFNMGIAIPGKTVFLIETAPWLPVKSSKLFTFILHGCVTGNGAIERSSRFRWSDIKGYNKIDRYLRDHFVCAHSQWETALQWSLYLTITEHHKALIVRILLGIYESAALFYNAYIYICIERHKRDITDATAIYDHHVPLFPICILCI